MKIFATSLFIIIYFFSNAQNRSEKFGVLNPDDLRLKECPFEKEAPAVILFDYGVSQFIQEEGSGFIVNFKRHTRIKIFNEGGYDEGEIVIPLYISEHNREKVRDIKGFTYNFKDAKMEKTPLNIEQVYEEKISQYVYLKKFAMPKVTDGSIIEFTYTIDSPYHVHFRDWEFQNDIPTMYSQYSAAMIPFYSYRYRIQGVGNLDHFNQFEQKGIDRHFGGIIFRDYVYEFGLKNIPSFQDESFISSRTDYIKKLDFQLVEINHPGGYKQKFMDTWPKLANDLLDMDDFGRYIKKSTKWAAKNASQFSSLPESERSNAILNMVKSNYKWNRYEGKFAQKSFKDFQNELSGNIANINLLTIGILRANNIEAEPVIISTRDHGKVNTDFPYSDFFNYVLILAKVDNSYQLLDATQGFCPNQLIPEECINGQGFVVSEDSENWITIDNNAPSLEKTNLQYSINLDNFTIEGQCNKTSTGYIAIDQRRSYYSNQDKFKKKYESLGLSEDDDITVDNLMDEEKPFEFSFTFNQNIDVIDDQIILHPFAHFPIKENPFKQEKRMLPVDMVNKKAYRYSALIDIPLGYTIDVLPEKQTIQKEDLMLTFLSQKMDNNKIRIYASYNFNKSTYPAKSYDELKQFMTKVTQILNSKIVLIKDEQLTMN
ncbi:DUF3857 domain-containing protein [Carboxylicivirga linearis]|uniref:DUF3857 domain-containing protein n=1 Tax=Carboxylicivirga linearis TaxID=1628157 RepID=A0ABS5JUR2_9BACT|nr:DUF3857 domain-containing protein [Carboxylicivirga linearis]MBS2098563.1 DUF3857 domain-containing protein [Carboxylicivirga linearis]